MAAELGRKMLEENDGLRGMYSELEQKHEKTMKVRKCTFNSLNHNISMYTLYSPYCFPYIFCGDDEENLLNNQDLFFLLITSFFLTTFLFD